MNQINILHLSDLHYDSLREKDLSIILNALLTDLKGLKDHENTRPHIVAFSGDLVKTGDSKNDFEKVESNFITPLLETLGLDYDSFFLSPGNHDLQKSSVKEIHELGLKQALTDRDKINQLFDTIDDNQEYFERLNNYNIFRDSLSSKNIITSNILYSTHQITINGFSVGIACLNSSWRSSCKGDEADYGKLLVAERQLDTAVKDIKDCQLRIGLFHHPFEWINIIERINIKLRAFQHFDLLLFGHNHEPEPRYEYSGSHGALQNICGCLYQSRDYYNGYSIINYNLVEKKVNIYLRSYFNQRRQFDKALNYVREGIASFELLDKHVDKNDVIPTNVFYADDYYSLMVNRSSKSILSSMVDCNAPKDIREIFVDPLLSKQQYEKQNIYNLKDRKEEQKNYIKITDLMESDDNYLILGTKESGKSTLLKYIFLNGLEYFESSQHLFPILINFDDMPKGEKPVHKVINNFIMETGLKIRIDELLRKRCLILIDDTNFHEKKKLDSLIKFVTQFPNNKYILATNQDLFVSFSLESLEKLSTFQKIYIHPYTKKHVRIMVQKWFRKSKSETEEIADNIMNLISRLHISRTPFVVSMLLLIFEKQGHYTPLNKAVLIENFIETILEKVNITEKQFGGLDYRDKQYYLSYIAAKMLKKKETFFLRDELVEETRNFFRYCFNDPNYLKGNILPFIDYFIQNGILLENNNEMHFKFKCFYEYFVAKRMIDDKSFYHYIMKEENYLDFVNVIDYLTGIQKNNIEVLSILENWMDKIYYTLNLDGIDLNLFETMNIGKTLLEEIPAGDIINRIKDAKLKDDELKDDEQAELLDLLNSSELPEEDRMQSDEFEEIKTKMGMKFFSSITLFSRVLKNCQLIEDTDIKKYYLKKCVIYWGKYLLFFCFFHEKEMKQLIEDDLEKKKEEKVETEEKDIYTAKLLVTLMFATIISEALGDERMGNIILTRQFNM
jgi:predicted MPP superfamily phosphohydrolase